MSRRASSQLQVEPLEGRLVLSVGFSTGYYTVSDQAGTATITRRFSRPLNLLISHPTPAADEAVFPGFFGL